MECLELIRRAPLQNQVYIASSASIYVYRTNPALHSIKLNVWGLSAPNMAV